MLWTWLDTREPITAWMHDDGYVLSKVGWAVVVAVLPGRGTAA